MAVPGGILGGMWRAGRDWLAGAVLVFVGLLLLAERRLPDLVPVIPLVVGLLLLGLFLVRRSAAVLVLGCVLTGAGVGVLVDRESSSLSGIAFPASVAAGFLVAWLAGLVLGIRALRAWPLVAALAAGALAAAVAIGGVGEEVRRLAVAWWPLAVIALGLVLLASARLGRRGVHPDDDTRPVAIVEAPPDAHW